MCGICGTIGIFGKEERDAVVNKMNEAIIHRGPDESGWYSDEVCTLAMRRLSIIDLDQGTQPKYNKNKTRLIFFNGEIYNYQELRNDLIEKGYFFHSNSDTEVIVNLYEEHGDNMLLLLKGMFAFCIYDKEKEDFFFARDRFGEKPLFYYQKGSGLIFSSEVKSLLENPAVERILSRENMAYYLKVTFVPEPGTLLKGVYSLPAGSFMKFSKGKLTVSKYFDVDYRIDKNIKTIEDASSVIKPVFEQAIKRQMISDVPLGAFLSGGVDSSAVVAQMQMVSSKPIKTFNVKFEESSYDESPIAREVASILGTEHHELVISNAEFKEEIFWKIIDHVGLPFPDSSAIPTWFITHEIKKHVTVALSGDGGDELFGGYPVFDWYRKIRAVNRITPNFIREAGEGVLAMAKKAPLFRSSSMLRQMEKGLHLAGISEQALPIEIHALFDDYQIYQMTGVKSDYQMMHDTPDKSEEWSDLRKIMYYRLRYNLPLDMLVKVDRMSMSNSLEVRAPFLDPDLFAISSTLPDHLLREAGIGKLALREMMKGILPDSVFSHPKSGFSIPLHKYQNKQFEELVAQLFSETSPFTNLIPKDILTYIKIQGLQNKSNNSAISVYKSSHQLWSLLQLAGWMKRFAVKVDE
ncbi:MAG: asparagine synthase (glutamine-hydrolyzing) [Cytophagaceae bacterium]|nr:asparagine synthase (glutamine-hydrolyzing) [Cytophagaceae bacterium]